ncbi:unnamed protein product [Rhodiola kirilowii]
MDHVNNKTGQYSYMRKFNAFMSTDHDTPSAMSEKEQGNDYFKQKKFKEAIDCYSRSIGLSPTAVVYANRAMAYLKIRRQGLRRGLPPVPELWRPCGRMVLPVEGSQRMVLPVEGSGVVEAMCSRVPDSDGAAVVFGRPEVGDNSKFEFENKSTDTVESYCPASKESNQVVQETNPGEDVDGISWAALVRLGSTVTSKKVDNVSQEVGAGSNHTGEGLDRSEAGISRGQSLITPMSLENLDRGDEEDSAGLSGKQMNALKMTRREGSRAKKTIKYKRRHKLRVERAERILEKESDSIQNATGVIEEEIETERRRLQWEEAKQSYKVGLELGVKGSLPEDDMIQIFVEQLERELRERCNADFALKLEPNNQEVKKQYSEAKYLYEKDLFHRTTQGAEKTKGTSVHLQELGSPPIRSQKTTLGSAMKEGITKRKHLPSKLEQKPSVQELAARAASRASKETAQNIIPPNSAYQFEVTWRGFSGDRALEARLLKATSPSVLPRLFKNALTSTMLVDIVRCLATIFREEMELTVQYLENLTKVSRFDMVILCLSPAEKTEMANIWNDVFTNKAIPMEYAERLDSLRHKYSR